jgi:hypothetical protein
MAKRRKAPPARKPAVAHVEEHSLLLRSAESLGRVIGALQRQLDDASRRLGAGKSSGKMNGSDGNGSKSVRKKKTAKKTAARPPVRKRKRATH